jgi:hypothetical protein
MSTPNTPISLFDYDSRLRLHDWYYQYSDDHGVWCRGDSEQTALVDRIKESPEHKELYHAWVTYFFSGNSFNNPEFTQEERDAIRRRLGVIE